MSLAYNSRKNICIFHIQSWYRIYYIIYIIVFRSVYIYGVYVYEQKFTMAEIMRMRMFKMLQLKFNKSYKNVPWTVFKGQ